VDYNVLVQFLIFTASFIVIWLASDKVIDYAVQTANIFKVTTLFIGFIFIGFAMSLPEVAIVISSAFNQIPEIAVGNVMGANFNNLSLVLGTTALFGGILSIKEKAKNHILTLLLIIVFIMGFVFFIDNLSQVHGLLLLLFYLLAVLWMWNTRKVVEYSQEFEEFEQRKKGINYHKIITLSKLFLSIAVVLIAAEFAVNYSENIASFLNLPLETFGATILAIVTTVPEFALSLSAIRKKEFSMAVVTLIGSILPHLCLCLGVLTFLVGKSIALTQIKSFIVFIFVALFIIGFSIVKRNKITRFAGFGLVCLFFFSLAYHLFIN